MAESEQTERAERAEREERDPAVDDLDVETDASEEVIGGTSRSGPVPIPYPN